MTKNSVYITDSEDQKRAFKECPFYRYQNFKLLV